MHRFRIDAIPDPQSLPRIAGFFAQRAMIPSAMRMRMLRRQMRVEVTVDGLDAVQAAIIAAKLGEMFAVIEVELVAPENIRHSGDGRNLSLAA
ncbi:hypothetical protein ATE67_17110 [Sphingopyxis sp. H050]|jgi:acetolactate synthase regulatory subunit|uniref:hypothetical protein n=1 Tax=Sphingopyxis sp. H050 TaxID=1759072 RepID=UPI000736FE52|nr:hypothetical protein [Sphingopyxis sp. H050]KTE18814.1 hypothetical protein ATE67_17110 [Sphingopyxis sp. H050]